MSGNAAPCAFPVMATGCSQALSPARKIAWLKAGVASAIPVLPLEAPVDAHYAEIRAELEAAGRPIGPNDLIIAAHARALGLTLVTHKAGEFARVPGLDVEDWLG